ncbi:MAG: ABC-type transport auxiliary lipoprotein family protein [Roseovarius sp.]
MPSKPVIPLFVAIAALAACGGPPDQRLAVPKAPVAEKQPVRYSTIALREVSLPSYAALEEIYVADETGLLTTREGVIWADDPVRAITLEISRYLSNITGAQVVAEPWPFDEPAQATLELRIEDMLARSDGTFQLAGQYYISSEGGRGRTRLFDLSVPMPEEDGVTAIATARSQAVRDLALEIARQGLR